MYLDSIFNAVLDIKWIVSVSRVVWGDWYDSDNLDGGCSRPAMRAAATRLWPLMMVPVSRTTENEPAY